MSSGSGATRGGRQASFPGSGSSSTLAPHLVPLPPLSCFGPVRTAYVPQIVDRAFSQDIAKAYRPGRPLDPQALNQVGGGDLVRVPAR